MMHGTGLASRWCRCTCAVVQMTARLYEAASISAGTCVGSACFRTAMCILSGCCAGAVSLCVILTRRVIAMNALHSEVLPKSTKRLPDPEPSFEEPGGESMEDVVV